MSPTIPEYFGCSIAYLNQQLPGWKNEFIAGAELEIEHLKEHSATYLDHAKIVVVNDGSLRNNGKEYLLPPRRKADLIHLFTRLHQEWVQYGPKAFSSRTSTHVHVNVLGSTVDQVKSLLYLYAIFEPLAFCFVGEERKNNIHCVPLNYTHMPSLYKYDLAEITEKWHKYTAFNLIPSQTIGTVEFRHLEGTNNVNRFSAWLNFLKTLYDCAHEINTFSPNLLTDLSYLERVCKLILTPDFINECKVKPNNFRVEDNLLDVKLSFI